MLANRDTVGSTLPLHLCMVTTFSQPCGPGIPLMCFFHTPFSVSRPPLATCLATPSPLFSLLSVWPFSRPSFHHPTACTEAGVLSHRIHFGAIRPGHHSAKWDGTPQPRSQVVDGAALLRARRRKESVYLELTGRHGRVGLAVLACESGARWSSETQSFLRKLARRRRDMNLHHFRTSARLVAAQTEHDLGV